MITPESLAAPGTEHALQAALFQRLAIMSNLYPCLKLAYAIPNGGERNAIVASRLKAEGVKAGTPDICLPVAMCGYHALYIEMKLPKYRTHKNGGCSDKQVEIIAGLRNEGNLVVVEYDWVSAWETISYYITGMLYAT
jgi:hypothetical protein